MRRPSLFRSEGDAERHPVFDYRPPAYLVAVKWTGIGLAALAVVVALIVGLWHFAAGQVRDSVLAWVEGRRQAGLTVTFGRMDIGGFPFRLLLVVDKPHIADPAAPTPWGWQGERVVAEMRPWSLGRITVRAPGPHDVLWQSDGATHALHAGAVALTATLGLDGGRPTTARLEAGGVEVRGGAGGPAGAFKAEAATVDLGIPTTNADGTTHRTPVLDIALAVRGLGLPATVALPLGATVDLAEINASVLGAVPGGRLAEAAAAWRDDGGTVEVRRLAITYGPITVNADGTLALDKAMQPVGAFTARVEGFFEAVDALRAAGLVRARDAVTAKMVLGALSRRGEGGRPSLTVPLTLQDRRLYAGPVPLVEFPEVPWTAPAAPEPPAAGGPPNATSPVPRP